MARRDGYSNFAFEQALLPQDLDGTALAGIDIDTRGFDTIVFVVNVGVLTGGGDMSVDNKHTLAIHEADVSTAGGAGTYTSVVSTDMLHINATSGAITSGVFQSIASTTDASTVYFIGYKGNKRYVRLHFSGNGAPSVASIGAIAILGLPSDWPINTPVISD